MLDTNLAPKNAIRSFARRLLPFLVAGVTTAVSASEIFWVSDPAMPGEAVLVEGADLQDVDKLTLSSGGREHAIEAIQVSNHSFKFVLPKDVGPGTYKVSARAGKARLSFVVNRPTLYWTQAVRVPSSLVPPTLRAFGRSLSVSGEAVKGELSDGRTGRRWPLRSTQQSLWTAEFPISDVPPGSYRFTVQDVSGDVDGGVVQIPPPAKERPRLNVMEYGASGDGQKDDTVAIKAALAKAAEVAAEVYFPPGRYKLTDQLVLPPYVALRGHSADTVNLFWPDLATPPPALIAGTHHFSISDLTAYASNHQHFISNDFPADAHEEVSISNVVLRANPYRGELKQPEIAERLKKATTLSSGGGDLIRLKGRGLQVLDSDLQAGGRSIVLLEAKDALVSGNRIVNGRWGWYSISGPDGVIFEHNTVLGGDLMSTGGGINTLGGYSYARNVYFGNNVFRDFYGWDREAITSDGGFGLYFGHAISGRANRVVLGPKEAGMGDERQWIGSAMFILGGRGMGQYRSIRGAHLAEGIVELSTPFLVQPDETSIITVVPLQENFIFFRNSFIDTGVAIQYYGTSANHVIAENESIRTGGFFNTGRWYRHYQPSWYCQFLANRIIEGNVYRGGSNNAVLSGDAVIGSFGYQRPPNATPLVLGAIHRRNVIEKSGRFELDGTSDEAPATLDVIFEAEQPQLKKLVVKPGVKGLLTRDAN